MSSDLYILHNANAEDLCMFVTKISTPAQQTPKITKITNHKEAAGDIDLVVILIMLMMVMLPLMIMMSRMMLTRKDLIDHGLMLSLEIYLKPTGSILSRSQPDQTYWEIFQRNFVFHCLVTPLYNSFLPIGKIMSIKKRVPLTRAHLTILLDLERFLKSTEC